MKEVTRLKGHSFDYERFGANSGHVKARCSCGWSHENYMGIHTVADARKAYRRHLRIEAERQEARS